MSFTVNFLSPDLLSVRVKFPSRKSPFSAGSSIASAMELRMTNVSLKLTMVLTIFEPSLLSSVKRMTKKRKPRCFLKRLGSYLPRKIPFLLLLFVVLTGARARSQYQLKTHNVSGELPDPNADAIMSRCNVCSEKAYVNPCAHCDKKCCDDCREAHCDILKREISRVNNQVKRGWHRLEDCIQQVGTSNESLN